MNQLWHRPTQIIIKQNVLRGRANPLFTPDNIRDFHQVIIHNDSQMIGRVTIGLEQNLHINLTPGNLYIAPKLVLDGTHALFRDLHPNDTSFTGSH